MGISKYFHTKNYACRLHIVQNIAILTPKLGIIENYFGWRSASTQCSLVTLESLSPLVGSRCTAVVGLIAKELETITF